MKIFKFKHYKKNLDCGDESYNISAKYELKILRS